MPGWVEDLLKEMFYGPFYQLAKVVWDWCIGLSTGVISQDPQHFSPATWKFVTDTLYPWAMGIGLSMMNVFFICVFLKAASNLKENITLELCIEGMIRLVALNVLIQMGMKLMKTLFSMAALMGGMVLDFQAPDFFTGEVDAGSVLFWWFMGFLYFFIALICGMLIFLTLFSRYVKLYLLTVTLFAGDAEYGVGTGGLTKRRKAGVRSFLGNAFEIVVIALVMSISGRIIGGMDLQGDNFADFFDGFGQALTSSIYMIGMAVSVRGARSFMKETFPLIDHLFRNSERKEYKMKIDINKDFETAYQQSIWKGLDLNSC